MMLRLAKHHGLGNDFLVALDAEAALARSEEHRAELARRVCDRRRGVGADGLLLADHCDGRDHGHHHDHHHHGHGLGLGHDPRPVRMVLYNADGSRAEMSGNGIRCFGHALARRDGSLDARTITTDAGVRTVSLEPTPDPDVLLATVDMGTVTEISEPEGWSQLRTATDRPVAHLSLGNPHSVVAVADVCSVDLGGLGAQVPHVNLEIVQAGPEPDAVTMRVHERGAGITQACGTGACAAAVAATRWGLAQPRNGKLVVHMDGGSASVGIRPADGAGSPSVWLQGPTTYVATIDVPFS